MITIKPKWILEKRSFEENSERLISLLRERNTEHEIIEYIPFSFEFDFKKIYPEKACVICYTSINLMKVLQRESPLWVPHSYANFENYRCSNYYPHFLRHASVTNDTRAGINPAILKSKYGWSDLRPHSIYSHLNYVDLMEAQRRVFGIAREAKQFYHQSRTRSLFRRQQK